MEYNVGKGSLTNDLTFDTCFDMGGALLVMKFRNLVSSSPAVANVYVLIGHPWKEGRPSVDRGTSADPQTSFL